MKSTKCGPMPIKFGQHSAKFGSMSTKCQPILGRVRPGFVEIGHRGDAGRGRVRQKKELNHTHKFPKSCSPHVPESYTSRRALKLSNGCRNIAAWRGSSAPALRMCQQWLKSCLCSRDSARIRHSEETPGGVACLSGLGSSGLSRSRLDEGCRRNWLGARRRSRPNFSAEFAPQRLGLDDDRRQHRSAFLRGSRIWR